MKQVKFHQEIETNSNVTLYENAFSFLALPFESGLIQTDLGQAGVAGFFEAFVLVQFRQNCEIFPL